MGGRLAAGGRSLRDVSAVGGASVLRNAAGRGAAGGRRVFTVRRVAGRDPSGAL